MDTGRRRSPTIPLNPVQALSQVPGQDQTGTQGDRADEARDQALSEVRSRCERAVAKPGTGCRVTNLRPGIGGLTPTERTALACVLDAPTARPGIRGRLCPPIL